MHLPEKESQGQIGTSKLDWSLGTTNPVRISLGGNWDGDEGLPQLSVFLLWPQSELTLLSSQVWCFWHVLWLFIAIQEEEEDFSNWWEGERSPQGCSFPVGRVKVFRIAGWTCAQHSCLLCMGTPRWLPILHLCSPPLLWKVNSEALWGVQFCRVLQLNPALDHAFLSLTPVSYFTIHSDSGGKGVIK